MLSTFAWIIVITTNKLMVSTHHSIVRWVTVDLTSSPTVFSNKPKTKITNLNAGVTVFYDSFVLFPLSVDIANKSHWCPFLHCVCTLPHRIEDVKNFFELYIELEH